MARLKKMIRGKPGQAPGTLVHIGEKRSEKVRIRAFNFDAATVEEAAIAKASECAAYRDQPTITWINVDGLQDTALIEEIGRGFNLHPLLLEDIVNTTQRPKLEDYGDCLFLVVKMIGYNADLKQLDVEQVSIILGKGFVLSFQEKEGDVFDPLRERIRNAKGLVRRMGADYLAYAMLDAITDNYFVTLEQFGAEMDAIDDDFINRPPPKLPSDIYRLKRELLFVRKAVWPMRELVGGLQKGESPLVRKQTQPYLRDLYDHIVQIVDTTETFRDLIGGQLDLYLSSLSNRMNEVMKVLTIIATIFIPLTFIAGIYGMNFERMPELHWRMGYYSVLGLMAIIAAVMLFYFRRKKWL